LCPCPPAKPETYPISRQVSNPRNEGPELRYVSANGGIRWHHHWVNVSTCYTGEYVGLEEIDDGIWNVYFGALKLVASVNVTCASKMLMVN
jgi:hypothetical protein